MAIKQTTDVHFVVSIHALKNSGGTPAVGIATKGKDATTKASIYTDLYSLSADFDEATGVYSQAEAMFEADNFKGPVEVVTYPNVD